MPKKKKGNLSYCPFCGILLHWKKENDIAFSNIVYLRCKNCGGEISINQNSVHNDDLYNKHNVFTVENVGGYNLAKVTVRENLSVEQLDIKAQQCIGQILAQKQNKKAVLNVLVDDNGNTIRTPKQARNQQRGKKGIRFLVGLLMLGFIAFSVYYLLFVL